MRWFEVGWCQTRSRDVFAATPVDYTNDFAPFANLFRISNIDESWPEINNTELFKPPQRAHTASAHLLIERVLMYGGSGTPGHLFMSSSNSCSSLLYIHSFG